MKTDLLRMAKYALLILKVFSKSLGILNSTHPQFSSKFLQIPNCSFRFENKCQIFSFRWYYTALGPFSILCPRNSARLGITVNVMFLICRNFLLGRRYADTATMSIMISVQKRISQMSENVWVSDFKVRSIYFNCGLLLLAVGESWLGLVQIWFFNYVMGWRQVA